ncbi:hypothetical protein SADUNF_Sadunf02G0113700 [Salix dunnii]|uniref:Uncharacterized protein n=1 Tax=Salix dunnii TaxID=1413687 RepID=A0A835N7E9_9ROSI|nr:hypothetical protein SADUNF_Sadunf02G0113700 [Salix dunnii]
MYRLVSEQLQPMKGLQKLSKCIEECRLRRAAVTNAPISDTELLISMLGSSFIKVFVLLGLCFRDKKAGMAVVGLSTRNPELLLFKDFDDPNLWTELEKLERGRDNHNHLLSTGIQCDRGDKSRGKSHITHVPRVSYLWLHNTITK